MTLREGNREYFYQQLDRLFPHMKEKYIKSYGQQYQLRSPNHATLMRQFHAFCTANGIVHDNQAIFDYLSAFPEEAVSNQLSLF